MDATLARLPVQAFDFLYFLDRYAEAFGKDALIVRTYDKKRFAGLEYGILADFFSLLGVNPAILEKKQDRNRGYSGNAFQLAMQVNKSLTKEQRAGLRKLLQQFDARKPHERYDFFTVPERVAFLDRYAETNRRVAELYCGSGDAPLFDDFEPENQKAPADYLAPEPDKVERALASLVTILLGRTEELEAKITELEAMMTRTISYRLRNNLNKLRRKLPFTFKK